MHAPLLISCVLATLAQPALATQLKTNSPADLVGNTPDNSPLDLLQNPESDVPLYPYYELISMPIDAVHKKARIAYKDETKQDVIGIDVFVKGSPLYLQPFLWGWGRDRFSKYRLLDVDLPLEHSSWSSAAVSHTYKPKKYTVREKIMRNKFSDYYLRLRCPQGADYEETKQIVEQLNTGHRTLKGITSINNFTVITGSKSMTYFSRKPGKGDVSTLYLDAEYEKLEVGDAEIYGAFSDRIEWYMFFGIILGLPFLVFSEVLYHLIWINTWFLAVLALPLGVIEIFVWDAFAKQVAYV